MQNCDFLICYDISDEKRLKKVAKQLEKLSIRIQKSVFFYKNASKNNIKILATALNNLINEKEDDIRIYQIDICKSMHFNNGISLVRPNILT